MKTKEILLDYWRSWHSHSDWTHTRSFLSDDVVFDAGEFVLHSADALIAAMQQGNPWKDIVLISTVFDDEKGSLMYEGTDAVTGHRMRIGEHLTLKGDKISKCFLVMKEIIKEKE